MPKLTGPRLRWVLTEAAKHTTPESMRRRIALAEKQLLALEGLSHSRDTQKAQEAHKELISVLSERLDGHTRANRVANFA